MRACPLLQVPEVTEEYIPLVWLLEPPEAAQEHALKPLQERRPSATWSYLRLEGPVNQKRKPSECKWHLVDPREYWAGGNCTVPQGLCILENSARWHSEWQWQH